MIFWIRSAAAVISQCDQHCRWVSGGVGEGSEEAERCIELFGGVAVLRGHPAELVAGLIGVGPVHDEEGAGFGLECGECFDED